MMVHQRVFQAVVITEKNITPRRASSMTIRMTLVVEATTIYHSLVTMFTIVGGFIINSNRDQQPPIHEVHDIGKMIALNSIISSFGCN